MISLSFYVLAIIFILVPIGAVITFLVSTIIPLIWCGIKFIGWKISQIK